jgi:hypothetical protein
MPMREAGRPQLARELSERDPVVMASRLPRLCLPENR